MNVTYIHHSGFLVETERFCYLFDYESGSLPEMDVDKPVLVLSSHSHSDHYNPEIFNLLSGMKHVRAILSDDIAATSDADALMVSPGREYDIGDRKKVTTFRSTDMGVAFLVEEGETLIYHAGDLNEWVWEGESESWNRQMTADYRRQMALLSETLNGREIDTAFVVLDPRQEKDYDRGLTYFLENIPAKAVYPMHYWDRPETIDAFLQDHPEYASRIQRTE